MTQKEQPATGDSGTAHPDAMEILYATPDPKEELSDVRKRYLPSELRERYWIEQGAEEGGWRGRTRDFRGTSGLSGLRKGQLQGWRIAREAEIRSVQGTKGWVHPTLRPGNPSEALKNRCAAIL